mgnify:CR=1 FL=1
MATISNNTTGLYTGYGGDLQRIGAGIVSGVYATPEYAEKKVDVISPSGALVDISYNGFELDPSPLILTIKNEPSINCIQAINLRYMDTSTRKALLQFIIQSNAARIQSGQTLLVTYESLARRFSQVVPYVIRRYKHQLTRIIQPKSGGKGVVPLVEWPNMTKLDSPFEGKYKEFARGQR